MLLQLKALVKSLSAIDDKYDVNTVQMSLLRSLLYTLCTAQLAPALACGVASIALRTAR